MKPHKAKMLKDFKEQIAHTPKDCPLHTESLRSPEDYICTWHDEGIHGQKCPDYKLKGKPSPLPWKTFKCQGGDLLIQDADGKVVVDSEWNGSMEAFHNEADAHYIITSVNLHVKLVAALEEAKILLDKELFRSARQVIIEAIAEAKKGGAR